MRAGILLSAAAHLLLIGLALWTLPWLRARPGPPAPVVRVSLVSGAELAAVTPPAPKPPEPLVLAPPPPVVVEPSLPPELPLEALPPDSLAPAFDPDAPLGIPTGDGGDAEAAAPTVGTVTVPVPPRPVERVVQVEPGSPAPVPPATQLLRSNPPMPRPSGAGRGAVAEEEARVEGAAAAPALTNVAVLAFQVAVQAAIVEAQEYPEAERQAGAIGTTRIEVSVARDGRLLQARVVQSSGSEALDRASLAAARRARLPQAPASLEGESFRFEVGLAYGPAAP